MTTININLTVNVDEALLRSLETVAPGLVAASIPATVTSAGSSAGEAVTAAGSATGLPTHVDESDIYGAINSDPRYSWRSMDAICKELPEVDAAAVKAKVREMVENGDLLTRDRRNGTTVYSEN